MQGPPSTKGKLSGPLGVPGLEFRLALGRLTFGKRSTDGAKSYRLMYRRW